jgi:hypothetical protein
MQNKEIEQYTLLLQKEPQEIRKTSKSLLRYRRSSFSEPAIDLHLFVKPRSQATPLHHGPLETKVGLQTLVRCSASCGTTHQPCPSTRVCEVSGRTGPQNMGLQIKCYYMYLFYRRKKKPNVCP